MKTIAVPTLHLNPSTLIGWAVGLLCGVVLTLAITLVLNMPGDALDKSTSVAVPAAESAPALDHGNTLDDHRNLNQPAITNNLDESNPDVLPEIPEGNGLVPPPLNEIEYWQSRPAVPPCGPACGGPMEHGW